MFTRYSVSTRQERPAFLGIVGLLCLLILSANGANAETWTVGGGSGPRSLDTIAGAVSQAADGDSILIYPGTYAGGIQCTKALTFVANGGPGSVVINSPGAVGMHLLAVQGQVIFESIRFSNGYGYRGGALLIEMAVDGVIIRDCIFDNNTATGSGGAIDAWGATVTIEGCLFLRNEAVSAQSYGGAVVLRETAVGSVISDCVFTENWAPIGGAVYHSGNITITGCTFTANGAGTGGGAIASDSSEGGLIHLCRFRENTSNQDGGAISLYDGYMTVLGCVFDQNRSARGGDIFIQGVQSLVLNCTFYRGRATTAGGALYFDNVGGLVMQSIFAKAIDLSSAVHVSGAGLPGFECNCFHDNDGGNFSNYDNQIGMNGNFQQDPEFCGSEVDGEIIDGNFNLQSDSPCAPGNVPSGCEDTIGACGVVCGTSLVQMSSWGQIKARFQ